MRPRPRLLSLALSLFIVTIASASRAQVKSQAKISATEGNFFGVIGDRERFGIGLTSLGDFDGDGIGDLAVGAYLGGYAPGEFGDTYTGEAYVILLNADGTVKSHVKFGDGLGGFTGDLDYYDEFGSAVGAIGDLDDDGVPDLAVGARLDDDGAVSNDANRGAAWIVFLNANGTVKTQQKISATAGGFTGGLDDGDWFGTFLTPLGDLDGDGLEDLLVAAPFDDDGGPDRGAYYVLFLNSNGTVKSQQKVSDLSGGFTGVLDDGDRFGTGPGTIGDLDMDGVVDLAVGALHDDDGGPDLGAVWIVNMNTDGTVKSQSKISATTGGFTGELSYQGGFGSASALVQVGDAVHRIAVSAKTDDDGGYNRGVLWLLDVSTDGTVAANQKISSTTGDFAGPLQDGDEFGLGLSPIGDFDGDGNTDLAVGARLDDDGGEDTGAVWLLFLGTCDLVAVPPSLEFGEVTVGASAEAKFALFNAGMGTVTGTIGEGCAEFSIVSGGGAFTLAAGDSILVAVRFAPNFAGPVECVVATGASCGQVVVSGTGVESAPEPRILSILDIPEDQGGRVRITFGRSGYDRPYAPVTLQQYEIYRRIDAPPSSPPAPASERRPALEGWDFVTATPIHGEDVYNVVVATLADSTKSRGMRWSVFMVRAASRNPFLFFDSAPDSGYSTDDIPPVPPSLFSVAYGTPHGNVLTWAASPSPDLFGYKIYRSTTQNAPGQGDGDFLVLTRGTQWTDAALGAHHYYSVASVDSAGNESDAVRPQQTSGTNGGVPKQLALRQNMPNPFNPSTTIGYDVPAPGGRLTLAVYDVRGRLVQTLRDGMETAGAKSTTWDGRDRGGQRVASGTYFYRIEFDGVVLTRKMTLLE